MIYLIKNKYWNIVEDYNLDKILYLLSDRPDEIWSDYDIIWLNEKYLPHRGYDLPAIINANDDLIWYKNDEHYRKNNKPVIICYDGVKEYCINEKYVTEI